MAFPRSREEMSETEKKCHDNDDCMYLDFQSLFDMIDTSESFKKAILRNDQGPHTVAHVLFYSICDKELPKGTTAKTFRFNIDFHEQIYMFGIYATVFHVFLTPPREVNTWLERNSMYYKIRMLFLENSERVPNGLIEWLETHEGNFRNLDKPVMVDESEN